MPNARVLAVALSSLALSACVVAPYPRHAAYYETGPVVVTDVAPPAPYVEPVPVVPFAGAIWIGGYWGWSGGRHVWVPGRWEHPRAGYVWTPHRWENRGGRWYFHEGAWARR